MVYHPLSCRRIAAVGVPVAAACLLLIGSATPAKAQTALQLAGCNSQTLADGSTITWTSSFSTDDFDWVQTGQTGIIANGSGVATAEVRWEIDPPADSLGTGSGLRGAGFTPSGVSGNVGGTAITLEPLEIVDCPISDEETVTFTAGGPAFELTVDFLSLHRPPRQSGVAKGSAHFNVFVNVGEGGDEAVLSVNLHVATGSDEEEG